MHAPNGQDEVKYTLAALAICQPDSGPARQLLTNKAYFNTRTGDKWDLFFPGYFCYGSMGDPHEQKFDDSWGFSPRAFNRFCRDLERATKGRWYYSGKSDLVLINVVVTNVEAELDFHSVLSGPMTDPRDGTKSLSLGEVIERISRDLAHGTESPAYGVEAVVQPRSIASVERGALPREVFVAVAASALVEVGAQALGLLP